ncbi:hypothetical protein HOY80DRAFT_1041577 [Tuber brumale]|nr:hypothetical protein HOY80DRAFT_1041577 [Tuber brumale]
MSRISICLIDWTLVKRRVRESGKEKRRRLLEEERDAVRKRMNVWRPAKVEVPNVLLGPRGMRVRFRSDSGYGSTVSSGFKSIVEGEGLDRVGAGLVPRILEGVRTGPRSYASVAMGSQRRLGFRSMRDFGKEQQGTKFGPDFGREWGGIVRT